MLSGIRDAVVRVAVYLAEQGRRSPVRVRAFVVAALTLLGVAVPGLAGIETNELLVGGILALVALLLGWWEPRPRDPETRETPGGGRANTSRSADA